MSSYSGSEKKTQTQDIVTESKTISKETIKRLVKDIKDITKNPLTSHGIYYKHHDSDFLRGSALIIGNEGTPYYGGYYLFNIYYPTDYPYSPPTVVYMTNDGQTRFNPNLYKCGKVCISILNTWKGEQWSSCQNISSILLVLSSVFTDKPLLNEPGISGIHKEIQLYNEILTFKNFDVAIYGMLELNKSFKETNGELYEIAKNHFIDNYSKIMERIQLKKTENKTIIMNVYNLNIHINYTTVINNLVRLYTNITNIQHAIYADLVSANASSGPMCK
jgi:ubiquitin-protein ligase